MNGAMILTIWLFSSTHREIESIYSCLVSGVVLWLTLANGMQKKYASSVHRLKRSGHFSLSWKPVRPLCEQAWAELLENERPHGTKPTIPHSSWGHLTTTCYMPTWQLIADVWVNPAKTRNAQLNPAQVTKLSNINDCCLSQKFGDHTYTAKAD